MLSSTSKEEPGQPGLHLYLPLTRKGAGRDLRARLSPSPPSDAHLKENLMNDVTGAEAQPSALSTNKARGGVTGHHVRYVLGFGLAGIIAAFIIMGVLYGFGS